jgi:hypothetical protein
VPREATEEMRFAAWFAQFKFVGVPDGEATELANRHVADPEQRGNDEAAYRAMLAAAPQATDPRDCAMPGGCTTVPHCENTRCYLDPPDAQATDPHDGEIERLKGELILAKASAEAAGSLLLDVQKDCIAERQGRLAAESRIATLTAERDAALDMLRLFVAHYPMGINPMLDDVYRSAYAVTAQPSKTETRDDG